MNLKDVKWVRTFLVALAARIVFIALMWPVMWIFSHWIDPGHDAGYYREFFFQNRGWISTWVGLPCFFLLGWWFASWMKSRPVPHLVLLWVFYTLGDIPIELLGGDLENFWQVLALAHFSKLIALYLGARISMARRSTKHMGQAGAVVVLVAGLGLGSCQMNGKQLGLRAEASARDRLSHFADRFYSAYNSMNVDSLVSLYDVSCRFVDTDAGINFSNRQQVDQMFRDAFSKNDYTAIQWKIEKKLIAEDAICVMGSWTGRFRDHPFETEFATILWVRNHKIERQVDYIDYRPLIRLWKRIGYSYQ